jgi:acyl-coenzyme A synthetase/AMP-(fatty) acid ligase
MIINRVEIDRSVTPARIAFPTSFNACGLFLDCHLDEGRAGKIVARGRTWTLTFGGLHTAVCKMGSVLKSLGVKSGDRVMLFAKDSPAFYIGFLGAIRIGAVVIPTNTFLRSGDYAYMLTDSKSRVVLVVDSTIDEVEAALSHPGVAVEHRIGIERPAQGLAQA